MKQNGLESNDFVKKQQGKNKPKDKPKGCRQDWKKR